MDFEKILDNLWGYDCEVTKYDNLFVFINYRTREKRIFHNATADELNTFISKPNMVLIGYNNRGYDKYILQSVIAGCDVTEVKEVNDYIIAGNNGYELDIPYVKIPPQIDIFPEITPRKSLKEIEGILCMDITESTVDFNIDHKWNKTETDEMIFYCIKDTEALFPIFEKLIKKYKAKYIISQLGSIDSVYALTQTDANLTAILLGASKKEHKDNFDYKYPAMVDKSKIPVEFLNYINDIILHNDLNYKPDAPLLDLGTIDFQTGLGGCHGFLKQGIIDYKRSDFDEINFTCE